VNSGILSIEETEPKPLQPLVTPDSSRKERDKIMAETTKKNNDKAKTTKIRAKVGAEAETVVNKDVETAPEVVSNTDADVIKFTEAEIANLTRTRDAIARGEYSDLTPEFKKLRFIKWLVENEKISR